MTSEPNPLQKIYADALEALTQLDPASNEYGTVLSRVKEIESLMCNSKPERPTPDTVVKALAMLAAIFGIMAFETRHAWVTKAGPFIMKFL